MEQFSQMIADALKLPVHRVEKYNLNYFKVVPQSRSSAVTARKLQGGLDEVQISEISSRYEKLLELSKRKETIQSTIESLGKLTDDLRRRIDGCWDATELEDIYLPYKPKRKTRLKQPVRKDWSLWLPG